MEGKIKRNKILLYSVSVFAVAIILFALALGDIRNPLYFWGALASIPCVGLGIFLYFRLVRLQNLKQLRANWGKTRAKKRDFQDLSHYFRRRRPDPQKALIDDSTWNDLNMNDLFALIDRTLTGPGASVLYCLLRTPCSQESAQELEHRNKLISVFQSHPKTREKLQLALLKMGKDNANTITHLLWDPLPPQNSFAFVYTLLALAALLALPAPFFLGSQGYLLIMAVFSLNSIVHYRVRKKYSYQIPSITSLAALLRTGRIIVRTDLPGLEAEQQQLRKASSSVQKILRKLGNLWSDSAPTSDLFFLLQYIQILFLVEIRSFYGALREIKDQIEALRDIYDIVGMLDALQAVASFRKGLDYVEPRFTSSRCLQVVDIRHPLLSNPVPNSIAIGEKGILITGSNMAGKSTFLRTLGVNAILAQSLFTCLAGSYLASYLQVASSISKADDIAQQKSLYYAEAERLLNIIRPEYNNIPALYLIDELLSGTNYTERLSASKAILNFLKGKNALVIIATHDLDLADALKESYQCYHFSDKIDEARLQFDYLLKQGVATTRNAIRLLEHLGYPEEIIAEANANHASK